MPDLLTTFKEKAESLVATINDRGGIQATIASLRRQMAEADRRRAMYKLKSDLKQLDAQITEMITAVGVQAVGLHKADRLNSPELEPLCQHIVNLEAALARQKAELAKLEAIGNQAESSSDSGLCPNCGRPLIEGGTFCPHCGAPAPAGEGPKAETPQFCAHCGAELRPGAKFCAKCGQPVKVAAPESDAA